MLFESKAKKVKKPSETIQRNRGWNNQDFGTGKKAPSSDIFSVGTGGNKFPAPIRFRFGIDGAVKPKSGKVTVK